MTITVHDELIKQLQYSHKRVVIDKATLANQLTTAWSSLWTATGVPAGGATPGAVAVCNDATTGGLTNVLNQTSPVKNYLGYLELMCANSLATLEIHDRLVHMGGLNGTATTAQNVLIDLSTLLATSNLDARKGDANYSDVQWWIENYSDCGNTTVNLTVNAKFNDNTDANLTVLSLQRFRIGQSYSLNNLIAAAQAGKYIRGINTVTLSASTTGAGNWGVTATRYRSGTFLIIPNTVTKSPWYDTGLPEVLPSSCLSMIMQPTTTTTGIVRGTIKVCNG